MSQHYSNIEVEEHDGQWGRYVSVETPTLTRKIAIVGDEVIGGGLEKDVRDALRDHGYSV